MKLFSLEETQDKIRTLFEKDYVSFQILATHAQRYLSGIDSYGRLDLNSKDFLKELFEELADGEYYLMGELLKREKRKGTWNANGHSTAAPGSRENLTWTSWRKMLQRCYDKNSKRYEDYGGRGISVCDRWKDSYLDFVMDVGLRSSKELSLDRIDNEGNYEPGNVRWSDKKTQVRNSRHCHMVTWNGKTQPISVWADETGLAERKLQRRIASGWPIEEVFSTRNYKNGWHRRDQNNRLDGKSGKNK